MTVYVADIGGRPICAFDADDREEAQDFINQEALTNDLLSLEFEGRPLWDGVVPIEIRLADAQEAAMHDSSRAEAMAEEDFEDGEVCVTFLVATTDPAEDDDDDDDEANEDLEDEDEDKPE